MSARISTGINFALLAALISGVSVFINKFAVTAVPQPLLFTAVKNSGVALLISALLIASRKFHLIKKLSRREAVYLLSIGVIGGSLPFYLFFTGLSAIPAASAAIIHKTLVLWVAILAVPLLKEKLSPARIAVIFLLFGANAFLGGFPGFNYSRGEFYVLLATLLWSVETILAKKVLMHIDPDLVTASRMGIGSIVLLSLSHITNPLSLITVTGFNLTQWAWIGLTAVLLLAYVSVWYRALKFAPAVSVTAVLVGSTIITNILSAIFVTHSLNNTTVYQSLVIAVVLKYLVRLSPPAPVVSNTQG